MIECVFTLDYELYGNGTGALQTLVYEPAQRLADVFLRRGARFVVFVEAAELEKIDECRSDDGIDSVKRQVKEFSQEGFEIGLHLHPQWCNAYYDNAKWFLDISEYNICTLPQARIAQVVERAISYLRGLLDEPDFTPLSFRAGNWLFQPTEAAAAVLADCGIKLDSSVFKGGLQHNNTLDYRQSMKNGYYWPFRRDVNEPDPAGPCFELPIYTEMVPSWRLLTAKRLGSGNTYGNAGRSIRQRANRMRDFMRFRYPLKLDFSRMALKELTSMMGRIIQHDQRQPVLFRPIVAIGHTKDMPDPGVVDGFLSFLSDSGIAVSTFEKVYPRLLEQMDDPLPSLRAMA